MISKELKNVRFTYSDKIYKIIKLYGISPKSIGGEVELSKTEVFSLMRFLIRVCQKNFRSKKERR